MLLAPVFLYRGLRDGKYLGSLRERFGSLRFEADRRPVLWIHAVSVGELLAAEPLLRRAVDRFTQCRIIVSTTTATGQRLARERFNDLDVVYFPLDLPFAVRRALEQVRPAAVWLVETELWPNFLRRCRREGVEVALVNGRISDSSFRRYRLAGRWLARILDDITLFVVQTADDAGRLRELGAAAERMVVAGNLKYDLDEAALEARLKDRREQLRFSWSLDDERPLIVAGSTTRGEERLLGEALLEVRCRPGLERTRMLVAPRHPERFDEAEREIASLALKVVRRTWGAAADEADVLLLDTIGELAAVYCFADVVFVGGSLIGGGGHNVLEPALFGRPIVVGPHTSNFRQVVSDLRGAGALQQLVDAGQLGATLADLLGDTGRATAMGERARALMAANRGATGRTLVALARLPALALL